jgi:hypothetical protein
VNELAVYYVRLKYEGRAMARVLLVVVALTTLYGCGQSSTPGQKTQENTAGVEKTQGQTRPEQEATLPAYDVTSDQTCTRDGIAGKCLVVATDTHSRKNFTALTEHFRDANPEAKAVTITFLPNKSATEASGLGAWFASKEVARAFLGPEYTDSQIQSIMDDGGFLIGRTVGRSSEETTTLETTLSSTAHPTATATSSATTSPSATAAP